MATALDTLSNVNVLSMQRAPNQAATLNAFHAVKIDSGAILPEGTEVTYTDPDLGVVFYGRIVDVKKAYQNGEGVEYTCSDAYRTLAKQCAIVDIPGGGRSTRIQFVPGSSMNDALTAIFSGSRLSTILPGGLSNLLTDKTLPMVDRGGQSVDSWIDELIKSTPDGIAYVMPNSGSPLLKLRDYSAASDITLTQGTYSVINPATGELVLERGNLGGSLQRKYKRVSVEGCGEYTRHELQFLPVAEITKLSTFVYQYKWYIPDTPQKRVVCRYIDPDTGKCGERCSVRVRMGQAVGTETIGQLLWEFDNPEFVVESDGRVSLTVTHELHGWYLGGSLPDVPNLSAWFTYTTWDGGLFATVTSSDPKLDGEGEYIEQHDEYVKYTGPSISVDQTSLLTAIATNLAARLSGGPDTSGALQVHVKGLNSSLDLGSRITNFGNCRVQTINYDFIQRSMNLQISDIPSKVNTELNKQNTALKTLKGNNWVQNRSKYIDNCFCISNSDVTTVNDQGGSNPGQDKPPKPVSWDCNPFTWECQERADGGGKYKSLQDCRLDCRAVGVQFIPCVGCIPSGAAAGEYPDVAACEAAHPVGSPYNSFDFTDCKYRCDASLECVAGKEGAYTTIAACRTNCTDTGSGYGGSSGIETPPPPVDPTSGSNDPDTIEVLIDAVCNSTTKQIDKTYVTISLR